MPIPHGTKCDLSVGADTIGSAPHIQMCERDATVEIKQTKFPWPIYVCAEHAAVAREKWGDD